MQPQSLTIFPATQKLLRCETDLMDLSIKAGEKRTCIRQFRLVIGCLRPPTAHQSRSSRRRRRRVVVSREVDTCMRSHWTCDDRHVGVEVNRQIISYELTSDINATTIIFNLNLPTTGSHPPTISGNSGTDSMADSR